VSSQALPLTFALFCACVLFTLCQGLVHAAETPKPPDSKVLELIRARGAINVGIKTDFAPFGSLDASGKPEGFEIDLAHDIGKRLGVKTNLVVVSTDNRFQKLEQGAVDVLIATIGDTAARRQVATAIEPNYMSSGVKIGRAHV
jgi:polar amino acid transport system substrate-binding protein